MTNVDLGPLLSAARDRGVELPEDYVAFMGAGRDAELASRAPRLWPVAEIAAATEDGPLRFADGRPGTTYAFDGSGEIVELRGDEAIPHGRTLAEFLGSIALDPSMAERFHAAAFEPVELEGETLQFNHSLGIVEGETVLVAWLSQAAKRPQGLTLRLRVPGVTGAKGRGGTLVYKGEEGATVRIWADKDQRPEVRCSELRDGGMLTITNAWEGPGGRVDEGLNNCAIRVEEADGGVILHCSDGVGAWPTLDDLVARVEIAEGRRGEPLDAP